jgi:hypothetical protein
MKTTNGTGKITKEKLKSGETVYRFSIVRNMRILGKPTNQQLAYLGTIRASEVHQKSHTFWTIADKVIADLHNKNEIWFNDKEKTARVFEKIVPRPISSKAVTNKMSILEILAERGINLKSVPDSHLLLLQ